MARENTPQLRPVMGKSDSPIVDGKDLLDLDPHPDALAQFIKNCEAPMTIAIQGDWGSGKTSMMHLVSKKLAADDNEYGEATQIWFNTWQYSQFNAAEKLPILLMQSLLAQLVVMRKNNGLKDDDGHNERILRIAKALTGLGSQVAKKMTGLQFDKFIDSLLKADTLEPSTATELIKLREDFEWMVSAYLFDLGKKRDRDGKKPLPVNARLIIFIDDLDRLEPQRAVELMECMKIFLDIPQCVFVLAIDFDVVARGVNAKYSGAGSMELDHKKARAFFDKIIQVPYRMPVATYNIDGLLRDALGPDIPENELMANGARSSVGTNPRSLKRLINTFFLLKIVHGSTRDSGVSEPLLFLILAMQAAYPEFHQKLSEMDDSEQTWQYFTGESDQLSPVEGFPDTWLIDPGDIERFSVFCTNVRDAIAESVTKSSNGDVQSLRSELLRTALLHAAVTSSDSPSVASRPTSVRETGSSAIRETLSKYCQNNIQKELGHHFLQQLEKITPDKSSLRCESNRTMVAGPEGSHIKSLEWYVKGQEGRLAVLKLSRTSPHIKTRILKYNKLAPDSKEIWNQWLLADRGTLSKNGEELLINLDSKKEVEDVLEAIGSMVS